MKKKKTTKEKAAKKTATREAKATKQATKKTGAKKAAAKNATAIAKPAAQKKTRPTRPGARADFGAPVDGFFAKQPPHLRPMLDALRALVEEAAPAATASLKWGMPFYELGGEMMCALTAHRAHVNLILPGPPGTYPDPEGRLAGGGAMGKHLNLTSLDELPRTAVRRWLRAAAARARG